MSGRPASFHNRSACPPTPSRSDSSGISLNPSLSVGARHSASSTGSTSRSSIAAACLRRRRRRGAATRACGGAQLDLVPRDEVTLRRPPRVVARVPTNAEMHLVVARRQRARQRHGHRRVRPDLRHTQPAVLRRLHRRPAAPTMATRSSRPTNDRRLVMPQRSDSRTTLRRDGDRAIDPRNLAHRRMRLEVGRHQPVGDEVAVVGRVAEVAAVREALAAVGQPATQAVILPLPDEPALQPGRRRDGLPVVGERAVGVAHRVAVLAHDQRPGADAVGAVLADRLDLRVHRAGDVAGLHAAADPVRPSTAAVAFRRRASRRPRSAAAGWDRPGGSIPRAHRGSIRTRSRCRGSTG